MKYRRMTLSSRLHLNGSSGDLMAHPIETALVATDQSYERLLGSIDAQYADRIHIVLQWLAFADEPLLKDIPWWSRHPLKLSQIAQLCSANHSRRLPTFDEDRLISPDRIVELASGLLKLEEVPANRHISDDATVTRLAFVSDTAREFLLSDRIRSGPASRYSVSESGARDIILNTCLAYILHVTKMEGDVDKVVERYPLATYAALFWIDFLPEDASPKTLELLTSLFLGSQDKYQAWLRLVYEANESYLNNKHSGLVWILSRTSIEGYGCRAPPIVWASALGLTPIVETLIRKGHDINAAGPARASALYMAVHEDHPDILAILLKHGGDVAENYVDGKSLDMFDRSEISRSPMYYASMHGKAKLLELLLHEKSKHGRPGWMLEIATTLTAQFNNPACLQHLINAGVNLDSNGFDLNKVGKPLPEGGCALQKAAWYKSMEAFRMLLDAGADVNTRGGNYDTALQAAAWRGFSEMTQILLDAGADTTLTGGTFGTPLIASCWQGNKETTEMLLNAGCDIDVQWDLEDHILELNFRCAGEILEKEPDVRTEAEKQYPYGLAAEQDDESQPPAKDKDPASEAELRKRIATDMLSHAEYVKMHYGFYPERYDNPFKVVAKIRHSAARITSRLREACVQVDEHGRYFFTAMQAAVANERHGVVELLLEHGATMPLVIAIGDKEASGEAEAIARILRMQQSFRYEERGADGSTSSTGAGVLPQG